MNNSRILPIIILLVLSSCTYERHECTSSDDMCLNRTNGTGCTTGKWCDEQGRICGGSSCVGMGIGECQSGKCVPKSKLPRE